MKTLKLALGAMLAAGMSAALPSVSQAQYAPGGVNTQLAEQRKQKQDADAEVARVQKEVTRIKGRIQAKYETKDEWETAKANLKSAEAAYEGARKKAVQKLHTSPEYKAAKDKQLKSEQALQALQVDAKANPKNLDKAHQDRLEAGVALRNLESAAMAGEPKVAETKAALAEAKKAWEALQDELKEALQQDPEYLAAQEQLAQAQAQAEQIKLTIAQQAASDREARRAATEAQRGSRSPRSSGGRSGAYGGGGYR
jgi:chromosome segregation ATPase